MKRYYCKQCILRHHKINDRTLYETIDFISSIRYISSYRTALAFCILNYLDYWLVLAQSEVELLSQRSLLLSHLECLGLRVNLVKSANGYRSWEQFSTRSKWVLRSCQRVLWPYRGSQPPLRQEPLALSNRFRECWALWPPCPQCFNRACFVCGPFSASWSFNLTPGVTDACKVNRACVTDLGPWKCHQWMEQGVPLILVFKKKVVWSTFWFDNDFRNLPILDHLLFICQWCRFSSALLSTSQ